MYNPVVASVKMEVSSIIDLHACTIFKKKSEDSSWDNYIVKTEGAPTSKTTLLTNFRLVNITITVNTYYFLGKMATIKTYTSSYLLQDGERSVGFTVGSRIDRDKHEGKLIRYDHKPQISEYRKLLQLSGEASMKEII